MLTDIKIRKYIYSDCEAISKLFYDTVHSVNAKDYTPEQLKAWARDKLRLVNRQAELSKQNTLIAEIDGLTVGFGSITKSGCLDMLYVHKDYQGKGVATALCDQLEKDYSTIITYASITAKPFFERRGYRVITAQQVERLGVKLTNYEMQRSL